MVVINENYYIEVDSLCYTLKRKGSGVNKNGKPVKTDKTLGYYGDVQGCIGGAVKDAKLCAFKDKSYSLEEAFKKIREINESFESQLKSILEKLEA